jgi:hypothetical protein
MSAATHWAAGLIGQPWTPERNCWWLVREVFRQQHGIELPLVAVGQQGNDQALREVGQVSGWHPVGDVTPQEWDVVLMRGIHGRHVGVVTSANGRLGVLHNLEVVGVCWWPLDAMQWRQFSRREVWRKVIVCEEAGAQHAQ